MTCLSNHLSMQPLGRQRSTRIHAPPSQGNDVARSRKHFDVPPAPGRWPAQARGPLVLTNTTGRFRHRRTPAPAGDGTHGAPLASLRVPTAPPPGPTGALKRPAGRRAGAARPYGAAGGAPWSECRCGAAPNIPCGSADMPTLASRLRRSRRGRRRASAPASRTARSRGDGLLPRQRAHAGGYLADEISIGPGGRPADLALPTSSGGNRKGKEKKKGGGEGESAEENTREAPTAHQGRPAADGRAQLQRRQPALADGRGAHLSGSMRPTPPWLRLYTTLILPLAAFLNT